MSGTGCGDPRCRTDYCRGSQSVNEQDANQSDRLTLDDLRRQREGNRERIEAIKASMWAEVKERQQLRDRIARATWRVFHNTPPIEATDDEWDSWWGDSTQDEKALAYAQADAVIAELGLEVDLTYLSDDKTRRFFELRGFYQTDWKADDD